MNVEVVTVPPAISTDNVPVLNRHMAESAIQTATSSSKNNTLDDCDSQRFMSLWRPIMCRTNQMFPPPAPVTITRNSSSAATDLSIVTSTMSSYLHHAGQSVSSIGDVVKTCQPNNNIQNCLHPNNNNKIDCHQMAHPINIASPTTLGKSIPVHCVVMNTTTPCYLADAAMISTPSASGGIEGGATTPTKATCNSSSGHQAEESVDVDSYAIIPASTLFNQIVPVVLRKLGYSEDIIFNATGWLMMKNWRPLSLTQIASSERETVGGVLGELTTVATLRIYVRRNCSSNVSNHQSEMKNKVLRWLMTQSQNLINNARFPLDEKWQQKVIRGERPATPSADARRQFDVWFQQEMLRPSPTTTTQQQQQHLMMTRSNSDKINHHQQRHSPSSHNDQPIGSENNNNNLCMSAGLHSSSSSSQLSRDVSAVASSVAAPRVRMRTTFDPEQELPRLQRWFAENQHPTRFQLQLYVQELNELESRRGRKPLDVSNLVYWFKNARAAFKRAETRSGGCGKYNVMGGRESNGSWMTTGHSMREGMHLSSSGRLAGEDEEEEEEEESCDGDRRIRRRHHRRMMAEEEDPIDDEEDEDIDDEDDEEDDANSSVSDRSRRSFSLTHPSSVLPMKLEPLDLNRSSSCDERDTKIHHEISVDESEQQPMDAVIQPSVVPSNGIDDAADLDDDDDIGSQVSADSDSDPEDYAENLSLSKHPSDGMADGGHHNHKKVDPLLQHNTSGSSSSQDYAAAATAAAAAAATASGTGSSGGYSGFSGLNLSHAQLNPHGLVYMTSPYLQGIGSSLLHHQSAAAAAAAAAGLAHHLHHQSSSRAAIGMDPLSLTSSSGGGNCTDDRRKRNRTFIDPVTEVPRLEQWFSLNTHPSHSLVLRYTDELNRQPYRLKFPKLEPKNVQFWFKNRRAKCKRLKLSL